MDFDDVRRLSIIAMFSDDSLMDQLVLKGGNALAFVYQIGARASLDIHISIDGDFDDLDEARMKVGDVSVMVTHEDLLNYSCRSQGP